METFTIMDFFFFLMSQSLANPAPIILWLRSITFTALKRQENSHGSSLRYKLVIYKHTTPLSFLCDCDVGLWYCVKCRANVLWLLCCCGYCNITLKPKIPRKRHDTLHMLCCIMLMSPATCVIPFMEMLLFDIWCYCKLTLGTECCIICIGMYVQLM